MGSVKNPSFAGVFYPARPAELREVIRGCVGEAGPPGEAVRALIVPHAGYPYSGPVAGSGYARLRALRGRVRRVVLIGPSHRLGFEGLAVSGADAFATPLGEVPADRSGVAAALGFPCVRPLDGAFEGEHCLEVHLPFLQETLGAFSIVALLAGEAVPAEVAEVLGALWDAETLIVVSSDLSHYLPPERAREVDAATARAIEEGRLAEVGPERACGHVAVKALMEAARGRGLRIRAVDLRNSGDTTGPADAVVGYGAFLVSENRS